MKSSNYGSNLEAQLQQGRWIPCSIDHNFTQQKNIRTQWSSLGQLCINDRELPWGISPQKRALLEIHVMNVINELSGIWWPLRGMVWIGPTWDLWWSVRAPSGTLFFGGEMVGQLRIVFLKTKTLWCGAITRWWFQIFFIFTPTWGNDPIWLIFFRWVETTN